MTCGRRSTVSVRPVPSAPATVAAARRGIDRTTAERREVAERRVGDERHIPATAAVASVGTALRDVLLAPERQRAVAAPAGADDDTDAVVEHAAVARGAPRGR